MNQYPGPPAQHPQWAPYPPPPRRSPLAGCLVALLVIAALVIAAGVFVHAVGDRATSGAPSPPALGQAQTSAPLPHATSTVPSGRRPGVVDIDTQLGLRDLAAAGTGIMLDSTGTILTNNHVISGATKIDVVDTDNGRTYPARVLGYDRSRDVAVVRLAHAGGLKTASLGRSAGVRVGDVVTAVGNAGGKGGAPSVVTGRVTGTGQSIVAKDQSDSTSEQLKGLFQISAPIRPGDSGGPLQDSNGRVIGIDTAATVTGSNRGDSAQGEGQGYAIPIDQAMNIARQIERGQSSATVHIGETALLGVSVATTGGGAQGRGALVEKLIPGTPAEQSGLPAGALITSLSGTTVTSAETLTTLLLKYHPGDVVSIGWQDSGGAPHTTRIRLGTGPAQ